MRNYQDELRRGMLFYNLGMYESYNIVLEYDDPLDHVAIEAWVNTGKLKRMHSWSR